MKKKNIIYLIGFMGSGKSSVAPKLAELLQCKMLEMDREIEKRSGMSIPEIFSKEGEVSFRERETELLRDLTVGETVISCGGGIPKRRENRRLLREQGFVVYLRAKPETIFARTMRGREKRPLLVGRDSAGIEALMRERAPLYESIADWSMETDGKTPEEIAGEIRDEFEKI